ncbi:hypothetical protein Anapl_03607 [Anas platyrhynchos]|uniref:Uncharacterized protein n=1 Tax=Anas platyrhynchos TaxID=8839 RepID=R0M022_ANAPL|nr:hypothetical protein Anapl_03607 [Anas platyrhynchos]
MALWITEHGRDSKESLVKSPGTGPASAPLPKSHSSATQRAVLATDGISQLSAPRDADPGSPGKVQGTRGVHGQVLALCWELGQPWRSEQEPWEHPSRLLQGLWRGERDPGGAGKDEQPSCGQKSPHHRQIPPAAQALLVPELKSAAD